MLLYPLNHNEEALEILKKKKNVRVLLLPEISVKQPENSYDIKKINGGMIVQTIDSKLYDDYEVVTNRKPTDKELEYLRALKDVIINSQLKTNKEILDNDLALRISVMPIIIETNKYNWHCPVGIARKEKKWQKKNF